MSNEKPTLSDWRLWGYEDPDRFEPKGNPVLSKTRILYHRFRSRTIRYILHRFTMVQLDAVLTEKLRGKPLSKSYIVRHGQAMFNQGYHKGESNTKHLDKQEHKL